MNATFRDTFRRTTRANRAAFGKIHGAIRMTPPEVKTLNQLNPDHIEQLRQEFGDERLNQYLNEVEQMKEV